MNEKKQTKKALIMSITSMVLCVAMLVGMTFAWFTDTASTAVNKIQAGNLKLKVEYATAWDESGNPTTWADLKEFNGSLGFIQKTTDGYAVNADMKWEPGATYNLQQLRITNDGNLALKYKVEIAGIDGSAKLNDAIDWTMKLGNENYALGKMRSLGVDSTNFDLLTIQGHMKESAGNEYQNETIDGIKIAIYAIQDTVESDSFGNNYDATADGTPQFDSWNDNVSATENVKTNEDTIVQDREVNPTITATVPQGSTDATKLTLVKTKTETPANITIDAGNTALSAEVKLIDQDGNKVTANAGKFFTLTMDIGANLTVKNFYHNEARLSKATSLAGLTENDKYYYDKSTGIITFTTDDFSPFTAEIAFTGGNGTEAYPYLIATGEQACQMENAKGYFKFVEDVVVTDEIYLSGKTVVVDLNGHSVKLEYADGAKPNNGSVFYIGGKNSKLTINDNSTAQTGKVIGSDKTYTNKVTSAVRAGNYGKLTINGGHFYGMSEGTSCIFTYTSMSSGSKATVVINGGTFETASASNGTYFVLNHQDNATAGCTMTVNGGTFKEYNPGVTNVDPVNAKTGKISLGAGCSTTSKVIDGVTWYTVSK